MSIRVILGSPTPVYRQIVQQVSMAIASGRLVEGEALPTVRALADELFINPNTVARAYAELARDGIVEPRGTRGVFVAPRRQLYTRSERRRRIEPTLHAYISEALILGMTMDEILEQVQEEVEALSPRGGSKTRGS